jgi:aminomethyltransferase
MDGTEPESAVSPLTSPLHERHVALGAKFADFAGWSMPLEYPSGVVKEHTAVRERVGIFDVSHLGKITVVGPGAADYVNATLTNDLARIGPGKAQYTLCCDEATGGIVDDLIVYLHTEERVLLVPNAANTAEVARRLAEGAPDGVVVHDRHRDYVVLAVQGTASGRATNTCRSSRLPCPASTSATRAWWCAAPATPASAATSWSRPTTWRCRSGTP